jgi:hypothetical protein
MTAKPLRHRLDFLSPARKGLTVSPRTLPSASQDVHNAPFAGRPELHLVYARRAAHADAIAERVSRLVNSGLSYPDAATAARRSPSHSRLFRWSLSRRATTLATLAR